MVLLSGRGESKKPPDPEGAGASVRLRREDLFGLVDDVEAARAIELVVAVVARRLLEGRQRRVAVEVARGAHRVELSGADGGVAGVAVGAVQRVLVVGEAAAEAEAVGGVEAAGVRALDLGGSGRVAGDAS